jgi:hypothetical protein
MGAKCQASGIQQQALVGHNSALLLQDMLLQVVGRDQAGRNTPISDVCPRGHAVIVKA